jgi:hypothetical protein
MQVSLIAVPNIDAIWPHLREGFQRFIETMDSGLSTGDLWIKCRAEGAFLIVAHDAGVIRGASIWQQETRLSGRKLRCVALFGEGMDDWIQDMRAMAKSIGRDCGANAIGGDGRFGWQGIFPNAKRLYASYEEPIDG